MTDHAAEAIKKLHDAMGALDSGSLTLVPTDRLRDTVHDALEAAETVLNELLARVRALERRTSDVEQCLATGERGAQ